MHPNPAFRGADSAQNLAFAARRGFGTLALSAPDGPLLAHVPFVLDGGTVELHLARSNAIARAVLPAPAVLAVTGPDGYVSPDWYGLPDQVPTWNYVAVHLRGRLLAADPATLRAHLDRVSAAFEGRLPKPPWTAAKMTPDALARMMRAILPFRFEIAQVDGTWKLNQNKPPAVRAAAAAAVAGGIGSELAALSELMRHAGTD